MYVGVIKESEFLYDGYRCVILMNAFGFRTGYVGIPKDHSLYGKHYINMDIDCHGGLTYSDNKLHYRDDKDTWWIGFDTGHYFDLRDWEACFEQFKDYPETIEELRIIKDMENEYSLRGEIGEVRTLDFCKKECMSIVKQVKEYEKHKSNKRF